MGQSDSCSKGKFSIKFENTNRWNFQFFTRKNMKILYIFVNFNLYFCEFILYCEFQQTEVNLFSLFSTCDLGLVTLIIIQFYSFFLIHISHHYSGVCILYYYQLIFSHSITVIFIECSSRFISS